MASFPQFIPYTQVGEMVTEMVVVYPQPMHVGFVGFDLVFKIMWFLDIANMTFFLHI